jgi:putative membrane-bound dehydrogenase-like protein
MFICDQTPGRVTNRGCGVGAAEFQRKAARTSPLHCLQRIILPLLACASAAGADRHPALSPADALKNFRIEPGLRIELVVAEPLVINPVAFVFDGPRRLFVAEGRGYPDALEGGSKTTEGRVALLEDPDGDGRFDRRTEFATGLGYVNGLALWRGGVFVTAAPDILYLKDTNGDGIADMQRVVLTGFDITKTAQLRVSHPTLGFDGKMYVTSGLNGGKVTSPEHPERAAVVFNLKDGRFDPDTFEFENTSGRAQFGLTFEAYGRRFICSNRHPVLQVMLEPWHLSRNPHLAFSESTQEVSKVEAQAKVFPISRATISADFIPKLMGAPHTGTFTSASGVTVFGGTGLTPEHIGNVFICESAQNLIQRQVIRPEGASFRSEPPYSGKEFLATTDVWFRPVFLGHGPDGGLYVADMYRREIDHPRYVPEESRGLLDFESGKDRGRIYRIVKDAPRAQSAPDPKPDETVAQLVAGLESPDEWWRVRAFRLLLERGDRSAAPLIEKIIARGSRPESRARALWALQRLHSLTPAIVMGALRDAHAGVREQAVQLAGEMITAGNAGLVSAVIATAKDSDPRVRFCTALVLAGIGEASVIPALASIAVRDGEDRWTRAAVLTGIAGRMDEFLAALQREGTKNPKAFAVVMEHLGRVFGSGAPREAAGRFLEQMLTGDGDLSWRLASVLGLVEGYRGRSGSKSGANADVFGVLLGGQGRNTPALQAFLRSAAERATNDRLPTRERVTAVALLGYTDFAFAGPTLGQLLDSRHPPELQLQVVRALERLGDARGGTLLLAKENWSRYTPQVREAVLATLTAKPPLINVLFDAIKAGVIAPPEISSVRRTQLLKHADATVRQRAEGIFKEIEGGDRMQVYRTYRELLKQSSDVARGREAFMKACSACHTYQGVGGKVGPDLTGVRNQPADAILLHILVPNYEVMPTYQTVSITTQDGRSLSGWLAAETESNLTLRTAAGTEETVSRKTIASMTASGVSLMPDGLEQTMPKEDVANIVAFLKSDN